MPDEPNDRNSPARFRWGPFHRIHATVELNELVCSSGRLHGKPMRNIYQGSIPYAKAYRGPLPPDARGVEFMTAAEPGPASDPATARWGEGDNGVTTIRPGDEVE